MSADETAVVHPVRVKPRASSTRVAGERAGRLQIERVAINEVKRCLGLPSR